MSEPLALSVLVVDDERRARERLVRLLEDRAAVDRIACADTGDAAVEALRENAFDLVFLDVQMPGRSGLDVVEAMGPRHMPPTVFATAYDEFALQAFELAALDYLLKPFDNRRFAQAFGRAVTEVEQRTAHALANRFEHLLRASRGAEAPSEPDASASNTAASNTAASGAAASGAAASGAASPEAPSVPYIQRLTIDLPGKVKVIPTEDIRYITAENMCVKVHTSETTYLLRERMHVLEDRLDPAAFARIHRSTIVQLDLIETVLHRSGGNYAVRLDDRTVLKVSRSRREDLLARLETGAA